MIPARDDSSLAYLFKAPSAQAAYYSISLSGSYPHLLSNFTDIVQPYEAIRLVEIEG